MGTVIGFLTLLTVGAVILTAYGAENNDLGSVLLGGALSVLFLFLIFVTLMRWPSRAETKAPGLRPGETIRQRYEGKYLEGKRQGLNMVPYRVGPDMRLQPAGDAKAGWQTVRLTVAVIFLLGLAIWLIANAS